MKRILTLFLAVLMCITMFAACGNTPKESAAPVDSAEPSANVTDTAETDDPEETDIAATESDAGSITEKGKMTIGITIYEPMNFYDAENNLTGFDTEFAMAVCEKLGLEPDFVEINWETKEIELNAKSIDCIWNGMTITTDRAANMSISLPYVKNAQVVVVKADSDIAATADLVGKTVVAEIGSAGEDQIIGEDADESLAEAEYIGKSKQTDCLLEVKSGMASAAVLDWTLAKTMIGEGTDFADLKMIEDLELATEEYGIAFRKGSDMTEIVNTVIKDLVADGTLGTLAEKYGLTLDPAISE